jgi:hypothetical protein
MLCSLLVGTLFKVRVRPLLWQPAPHLLLLLCPLHLLLLLLALLLLLLTLALLLLADIHQLHHGKA